MPPTLHLQENLLQERNHQHPAAMINLRPTRHQQYKKGTLFNYVDDVLSKHDSASGQHGETRISPRQMRIGGRGGGGNDGEPGQSAFRRYNPNTQTRVDENSFDTDDEQRSTPTMQNTADSQHEVNFDPDPVIEERESRDQVYKQPVYLRQLQPPTPAPVEIQIQEVLIKPEIQRPPLHVRVASREPRTPSPILIKSAPPRPPLPEPEQPIIYNKYVPGPKPTPQQVRCT
ncbi:unnamed protein product [Didymodactylos carnosus]|uniref:Uncharacterized protein n=1 Tax=Didymodactylos carnosus TaxID=1234261 RepID=A0A815WK03_9BILA|nr:unnamed protein product [Didymodactylos carnosus]CAF4409601.1 unnamed protein product [Didymodactylos carnosus]